jgi:hypothetical protein
MGASAPLDLLAHGTFGGHGGTFFSAATGAIVTNPGAVAGTYNILMDAGEPGANSDVISSRVVLTVFGAANTNAAAVKSIVGGKLNIALTTQVGAGIASDADVDFIIYRDPNSQA